MTLAEWIFLLLFCYALYRALGPIQRWIEGRLYKILRGRTSSSKKPDITVTDYEKKERE